MTGQNVHADRVDAVVTLASEMTGRTLESLSYRKTEQSAYLVPAPETLIHIWQPDLDCPRLHIVVSECDDFETHDRWMTAKPFESDEEVAEMISGAILETTYLLMYDEY